MEERALLDYLGRPVDAFSLKVHQAYRLAAKLPLHAAWLEDGRAKRLSVKTGAVQTGVDISEAEIESRDDEFVKAADVFDRWQTGKFCIYRTWK